jgi:hypothetical protein
LRCEDVMGVKERREGTPSNYLTTTLVRVEVTSRSSTLRSTDGARFWQLRGTSRVLASKAGHLEARLHVAAGPDKGFSRPTTFDYFAIRAVASATYAKARMMSSLCTGVESHSSIHNVSILVRGGMVRELSMLSAQKSVFATVFHLRIGEMKTRACE